MDMFDPAHPGEIIREDCVKPLNLTVGAAAEALGVSRTQLSDVLNGHSGISAEMAVRLEKVGWGTADHWLRPQMQRNLWQVRRMPTRSRSGSASRGRRSPERGPAAGQFECQSRMGSRLADFGLVALTPDVR